MERNGCGLDLLFNIVYLVNMGGTGHFSNKKSLEITLTNPFIQETDESEITEYLNKTENSSLQTTFSIDDTHIDDSHINATNIDAKNIENTNQKVQDQNQIKVEGNEPEIFYLIVLYFLYFYFYFFFFTFFWGFIFYYKYSVVVKKDEKL